MSFSFVACNFKPFGVNPFSQELHTRLQEVVFLQFHSDAMLLQPLQYLLQVLQMLLVRRTCNQNIINVTHYTLNSLQQCVHSTLKNDAIPKGDLVYLYKPL